MLERCSWSSLGQRTVLVVGVVQTSIMDLLQSCDCVLSLCLDSNQQIEILHLQMSIGLSIKHNLLRLLSPEILWLWLILLLMPFLMNQVNWMSCQLSFHATWHALIMVESLLRAVGVYTLSEVWFNIDLWALQDMHTPGIDIWRYQMRLIIRSLDLIYRCHCVSNYRFMIASNRCSLIACTLIGIVWIIIAFGGKRNVMIEHAIFAVPLERWYFGVPIIICLLEPLSECLLQLLLRHISVIFSLAAQARKLILPNGLLFEVLLFLLFLASFLGIFAIGLS